MLNGEACRNALRVSFVMAGPILPVPAKPKKVIRNCSSEEIRLACGNRGSCPIEPNSGPDRFPQLAFRSEGRRAFGR